MSWHAQNESASLNIICSHLHLQVPVYQDVCSLAAFWALLTHTEQLIYFVTFIHAQLDTFKVRTPCVCVCVCLTQ